VHSCGSRARKGLELTQVLGQPGVALPCRSTGSSPSA
jgi:hypothetical protein